jgi:GAF domain-containing protein
LALIDVIAGQVAQAAENIRLIEEMRERSSRERTIREFTDKLRATPNLDALLSTATRELAERLNVRHAVMEIGIE